MFEKVILILGFICMLCIVGMTGCNVQKGSNAGYCGTQKHEHPPVPKKID